VQQACDCRNDVLRLVAVRRMPAPGQLQEFGLRNPGRDPHDLRHGAVCVVLALDGEHWATDRAEHFFEFQRRSSGFSQMSSTWDVCGKVLVKP
jgi:hypothetical protein